MLLLTARVTGEGAFECDAALLPGFPWGRVLGSVSQFAQKQLFGSLRIERYLWAAR